MHFIINTILMKKTIISVILLFVTNALFFDNLKDDQPIDVINSREY